MTEKKTRKEIHEDYDAFVEKFKSKKTTDDCYTPPAVYEAVVKWVNDKICPLDGVKIVRPFYPGGDFEHYDYPGGCIVIDNPPFSILAKIRRFYNDHGIKYFLFAPGLTLFSSFQGNDTYIVANANITYDNSANVITSFVTNLLNGDPRIMVAGDLYKLIEDAQKTPTPLKKVIAYPNTLISSALLGKIAVRGVCLSIPKAEAHFVRRLYCQKAKGIYGGGFLISERAAAERAAAERAAAERAAAERAAAERAAAERAAAERVMLSDREIAIIKSLGVNE